VGKKLTMWLTRPISNAGTINVNGDFVFASSAVAGEIVGIKQEGALRSRVASLTSTSELSRLSRLSRRPNLSARSLYVSLHRRRQTL